MDSPHFLESLPSGGSWWCLACNAPADLEEPGEPQPLCVRCGHRRCRWVAARPANKGTRVQAPAPVFVPVDAAPMVNHRRLPAAERPSLTRMALEGYLLCKGCNEPTKKDAEDCCALCGSSQVEFQEPTL